MNVEKMHRIQSTIFSCPKNARSHTLTSEVLIGDELCARQREQ